MRAARVHEYGTPDVVTIEEIPSPSPGEGQVRVRVHSASVNYPDVLMMGGRYQVSVPVPYVPGCEFSGVILETRPGVTGLAPGQPVTGMATHGAFAEEVVVDAWQLTPMPEGIDWNTAAAFGVTYTTAYHSLRTLAHVRPGEWVTVLGAAGGVGLATVDLARAMGARVLAAASGPERLEVCRERGAQACVDYQHEDLKARIREITGGGTDVTVDPVGGDHTEQALRSTRPRGRFVVVGFASGEIPRIPLNLVLLKTISVMGFENRTVLEHFPEAPAHRADLLRMLATGQISPYIGGVFPLADTAEALKRVADRRAIGKIVIDIGTA